MKTYYGSPASNGRKLTVTVRDNKLTYLKHHLRHSPDGFEWGYAGQGPAELSRSMLLDSFGVSDCPSAPDECQCYVTWVEPTYQAFKAEVIAGLKQDEDWKLSQERILDWVFDYLNEDHDDEIESIAEEPVPATA